MIIHFHWHSMTKNNLKTRKIRRTRIIYKKIKKKNTQSRVFIIINTFANKVDFVCASTQHSKKFLYVSSYTHRLDHVFSCRILVIALYFYFTLLNICRSFSLAFLLLFIFLFFTYIYVWTFISYVYVVLYLILYHMYTFDLFPFYHIINNN